MHQLKGYSKKGTPCFADENAKKNIKKSLVCAFSNNKIFNPLLIDGNFNKNNFSFWFNNLMKHISEKFIPQECIVVLDNASIHNKKTIFHYAKKYQIYVLFLPPYSPDLNPIENFWGLLKRNLRNSLALLPTISTFDHLSNFLFKFLHKTCYIN